MGEVASKGKVQGAGNAGGAMGGSISGQQRGRTQVLASSAYRGNTAFKEALHVPILPGPDMSGKASFLFPLMDVSGSMHAKLATAKEQICKQFVASTDANAVGMMAFTTEPYLVVPVSGMSSKRDKEDFEKTVKSLFIPSHSGTDIPAALLRYLQEINALLDRVPARSKLEMRKTSCVVITDGLNEVSDGTWNKVSEAVSDTRSRAKKKSCYLFFYLVNLQSSDVDENILQRLSQVLRAERAARAGLQPLQVYDTISQHMVTVEKCVSRISQVKEQLQKMDDESKGQKEHQTLTMTVIETSIKLVKVELKKHQVETQSFDNDLKTFEEETQNIFQVKASLLADDYRSKVQDALKGLQSQLESFDSQMSHVRGAVQSSRDQLQEMAAAALKSQYSQDLDRISVDLAAYEEFLEKSQVASEEMKEDLQETRKVLQEKEGRIIDFMKQNKNDQFDAGRLLARTQKQREKAHSLAKEMKMEAELKSWEFVPTPSEHEPLSECCICFKENGPSFTLFCGHAIFCAGCLAGHVKAKADQNLPAFCPAEGCSHELLQDEVDSFCAMAGQQEVARLYQKRCTQRRIEPRDSKVACPQGCGNLACSRLDDRSASCEKCKILFCTQCDSRSHPEQPDCVLFLEQQLKEAKESERRDMEQRLQTMKKLHQEGNVRVCPKCNYPYQKISGCDHIVCGKCQSSFHFDSTDARQQGNDHVQEEEQVLTHQLSSHSLGSASTSNSIQWQGWMKSP
ncbi:unnamed protein product [Effrenium voratum]|nr:unnamed protein product [Effrenium voratum]